MMIGKCVFSRDYNAVKMLWIFVYTFSNSQYVYCFSALIVSFDTKKFIVDL